MMEALQPDQPRHVLVVAYYFPPMGLSGVQRIAKMVKYLPAYNWHPTVLTVHPGGYFAYDETLLDELNHPDITIVRTASWDPTRLFSPGRTVSLPGEADRRRWAGLSQFLFVPDNKIGWYPVGLRAGMKCLKDQPFDAILSTAPPYTCHLLARRLSIKSKLPLVVDFRDDWVGNPRHRYPTPLHRWVNEWLEHRVMKRAALGLAINRPIQESLVARNSRAGFAPRVEVLPQGYDPADFEQATRTGKGEKMRFLYTGIFYDAQTPDFFLRAFQAFLEAHPERKEQVEAVFVGLLPESAKVLIKDLGLSEQVRYEGYCSHRETVDHLVFADVLWMTIGRRPGAEGISTGKLFEYLGSRKPILALVPEGAAREALRPYGAAHIVEPDDLEAITEGIHSMVEAWDRGALPEGEPAEVEMYDRRKLAGRLADLLEGVRKP